MDLRVVMRTAAITLLILSPSCRTRSAPADDSQHAERVPGSVAYPEPVTAGEKAPPADTPANPFGADRDAAQAGERLFSSMNCDGCHGGGGLGFVGPNLVDGRWRYGGGDAAVYQSIFSGRPRGMPAYGGILSDGTIWQLVTYLKTQPVPGDVATEAWP